MAFYVVIRGPLGCGKSTIAKMLASELGAKYFEVDRVLDEQGLTKDKEEGYVSQRSFKKVNEIIASDATSALELGATVVFDGNFYWKSQIEDLIERLDYPHFVFTLVAPLELCIERDKNRNKTHGEDAARAVYAKSTQFQYGIPIDVDKHLAECVSEIMTHIK
ncbi:MAG: AAA family ATPase [Candidatus Woesearchaeota archaeon]